MVVFALLEDALALGALGNLLCARAADLTMAPPASIAAVPAVQGRNNGSSSSSAPPLPFSGVPSLCRDSTTLVHRFDQQRTFLEQVRWRVRCLTLTSVVRGLVMQMLTTDKCTERARDALGAEQFATGRLEAVEQTTHALRVEAEHGHSCVTSIHVSEEISGEVLFEGTFHNFPISSTMQNSLRKPTTKINTP